MQERANDPTIPHGDATHSKAADRNALFNFERRNTQVLVVDEDLSARQQVVSFLENCGFPTTVSASGTEALDLLKRKDFGMIMTDLQLSDLDGMGLLKAAKVISPNCDVIIITGSPTVENAVASMRLGAVEYFTKPFDVSSLQKSIDRLVERRILERRLRVERHHLETPRFDEETGLFSNRYFHWLLSHEIGRCRRYEHSCGLLLAAVKGLTYEDTSLGHPAFNGDRVIKFIAQMLRSSCRQIDFIARYAFDEFAFLLPESGETGLHAVTTRIRHRIDGVNERLSAHASPMRLTASCGGAAFPHSGTTKDLLLAKAYENLLKCHP
ncbi:MAG: diguanylate cyclase [Terriglobia bacterium]